MHKRREEAKKRELAARSNREWEERVMTARGRREKEVQDKVKTKKELLAIKEQRYARAALEVQRRKDEEHMRLVEYNSKKQVCNI